MKFFSQTESVVCTCKRLSFQSAVVVDETCSESSLRHFLNVEEVTVPLLTKIVCTHVVCVFYCVCVCVCILRMQCTNTLPIHFVSN